MDEPTKRGDNFVRDTGIGCFIHLAKKGNYTRWIDINSSLNHMGCDPITSLNVFPDKNLADCPSSLKCNLNLTMRRYRVASPLCITEQMTIKRVHAASESFKDKDAHLSQPFTWLTDGSSRFSSLRENRHCIFVLEIFLLKSVICRRMNTWGHLHKIFSFISDFIFVRGREGPFHVFLFSQTWIGLLKYSTVKPIYSCQMKPPSSWALVVRIEGDRCGRKAWIHPPQHVLCVTVLIWKKGLLIRFRPFLQHEWYYSLLYIQLLF